MKLSHLPQFRRNAKRFEHIVHVLAKYGLARFLQDTDSDFFTKLISKRGGDKVGELSKLTSAVRIRMALGELGTTFIKLGQMLSTRSDLVGPEIAAELEQLQSNTPADPPEAVRRVVEAGLGAPPEELFATFEDTPLASASIAQVHLGTLKDGTEVVVKVQHEGIEDKIVNDLEILIALADFAERHSPDLRLYQPSATITEFRKNLLRELDFNLEQQNLSQFRQNFEGDETVHIPESFPALSARTVLTMERLQGASLKSIDQVPELRASRKVIAERGTNLFVEMIFRDRFYHADPHPGNLLILEDNVIGLLDCGMVAHLDSATEQNFEGIIQGFMTKDVELLTDHCLRLGKSPPDLDRELLESDIDIFVSENLRGSLKDLKIGKALAGISDLVRGHKIVLKPGTQLFLKVLIMLEGTGRLMDPDFQLMEVLEPVRKRTTERRLSPGTFFRRLWRSYHDWDRLMRALPRDLADLMDRVRQGTMDVHLEHRKLDAVVNRLTYGVLTAALFVSSSLLWSRNIPPRLFGASVPGVIGVVVAAWLSFRLLTAISKSGGLGSRDEEP